MLWIIFNKFTLIYDGIVCFVFFFFQAEDGIRDVAVTGVQTCALPISKGIPRKARTAGEAALTPSTIPLVVFTWSSANVAPANGISSNPANAAMRARPLPRVISPPGLVAYHNRDPPVFPLDLAKQRQRKSTRATYSDEGGQKCRGISIVACALIGWPHTQKRSEERRVGKECRSRWSPYH